MMSDKIILVLSVIGITVLAVFFMGFPTMWLWNTLMPDIFGLKTIGFWQAVGLNMLAGILFKPITYKSSTG